MQTIHGYNIIEKLDETRSAVIYRAQRSGGKHKDGKNTVIIKTLKARFPSVTDIATFKHEYEIIRRVDLNGVRKTYDIIDHGNGFALVLEDFDSISVKQLLVNKPALKLKSFLDMSIKVAETLGTLHNANIVHRDIKPHNLLVNLKKGDVKISDFGCSEMVTHENAEIYDADVIQGTLYYMSPEQTRRMNRSVDYRTDLYSLGVTFYEMLTGSVPFHSQDPMEVIHAHLAKAAVPPCEIRADIPQILSDIVIKLLAKNAEDRYQNAFGLAADLRKCLLQLESSNNIKSFALAEEDVSNRFIIPQKPIGREKEIDHLLTSFERVCRVTEDEHCTFEMTLVTGAPGVGKSALINEIAKPVTQKKGYFLSGKYEQLITDKPYSAIIQAFQRFVQQLLTESDSRVQRWREKIQNSLGQHGRIMTDIISDLELIIGRQPELPELAPKEASNRFNLFFGRFIRAVAQVEHPLVLFLDDLQWADMASLELLRNIATNPENTCLYLIGSYRANEMATSHPLMSIVEEIRKSGVTVNTIELTGFDSRTTTRLIRSFLKCSAEAGEALANTVLKKTGGNPFFIKEFLYTLHHEKLIQLDANRREWQWDIHKIDAMQMTDNVIELMTGKLEKLAEPVQDMLKLCACIGNRFDLETLSALSGKSVQSVLENLNDAIVENYVTFADNEYVFHHDRIQEAAYSLLSESKKPTMHLAIGRRLLSQSREKEALEHRLFDITDQLNLGASLITDAKEREELAILNQACGKKAKQSAAYPSALTYFEWGVGLLSKSCWQDQYELALDLYTEATEAAYLIGAFAKMYSYGEIVTNSVKTVIDAIRIYSTQMEACRAQLNFQEAVNIALDVLNRLDFPISNDPTHEDIQKVSLRAKSRRASTSVDSLVDLPEMTDPKKIAIARVLASLDVSAFYVSRKLYMFSVLSNFQLALEHGITPHHTFVFSGMAIVCTSELDDIEMGYEIGQTAFKLIDRLDTRQYDCRTKVVVNLFSTHWKTALSKLKPEFMKLYHLGLDTGDIEWASYSLGSYYYFGLLLGEELSQLEKQLTECRLMLLRLNQTPVIALSTIRLQMVLNLLGKSPSPTELSGTLFNQDDVVPKWEEAQAGTVLANFYSCRLILRCLFNEYRAAEHDYKLSARYIDRLKSLTTIRDIAFYAVVAKASLYTEATEEEQREIRRFVTATLDKYKHWSFHAPMNNEHRVAIIEAELAKISGDGERAGQLYDLGIELSEKYGFPIERALANELSARFYLDKKRTTIAKAYFQEAYAGYGRWGATAKLNQLMRQYPTLLSDETIRPITTEGTHTASDTRNTAKSYGTDSRVLDISTILKASQTISGEVSLPALLTKLMKITIENAGAQTCYVILADNGSLFVEAKGTIESESVSVLKSIPVNQCDSLAASIVNYTARTQENIILNNASQELKFRSDPYILKENPQSILCIPIVNQGNLSGVLYLENKVSANVFTPERCEVLNILSSQIAISIDNAKLYESLEEKVRKRTHELQTARDALWGEMELAKKIQTVLLPEKPIAQGYEIVGYMQPADEVGGDYYDIINVRGNDWFVIGDVSGHGVPAGLVMMMVQTSIHTVLETQPDLSPAKLLETVNAVIHNNLCRMKEDKYMTLTVIACTEEGQLIHAGLHQDILIYRHRTGKVTPVDTNGMWIGIAGNVEGGFYDSAIHLEVGDVMLLYTDGVTEAKLNDSNSNYERDLMRGHPESCTERHMFGNARLCKTLEKLSGGTLKDIRSGILHELKKYTCDDDVTLVLIRRVGDSSLTTTTELQP